MSSNQTYTYASVLQTDETTNNATIQEPVKKDFIRIKSMVTLFWEIFSATLGNLHMAHISHIVSSETPPESLYAGLTVYTVHNYSNEGCEPEYDKSTAAFPAGTCPRLQRAILRLNKGDTSVSAFLSPLTDTLRPIGARVDWLNVHVSPRFMIHYSHSALDNPTHSVFCITTQSGEEFIADFTIEQFGYVETFWYKEKFEYLAECTTNVWFHTADVDEMATVVENHAESEIWKGLTNTLRGVCSVTHWSTLDGLPID